MSHDVLASPLRLAVVSLASREWALVDRTSRPVLSLLARLASDLLVPDSPGLLLARAEEEEALKHQERGEESTERHKVSDLKVMMYLVQQLVRNGLTSFFGLVYSLSPSGRSRKSCASGEWRHTKNGGRSSAGGQQKEEAADHAK